MKKRKLSIVADENMPLVDEMFSEFGDIVKVDGRNLRSNQLKNVDVLLVRSVTRVDESLLQDSGVKFVGSATIGTDHIDLKYLKHNNIAFSSAPGCNADAVVEYDLCCISHLLAQRNEKLTDKSVAIIGVGNVGQRLADKLITLGVKELFLNDPPRATKEEGFVDLDFCLKHADIIALHTPLIKKGEYPTYHLISEVELDKLKENAILLNAGRGAAIKGDDLSAFLDKRKDVSAILDVWEKEPLVDINLAEKIDIATPHIAGYSLEGKMRGTFMLQQALAQFLDVKNTDQLIDYLPKAKIAGVHVNSNIDNLDLMNLSYDPYRDDRALRATLSLPNQESAFDLLRKNYPVRREFYSIKVAGDLSTEKCEELQNLGFTVQ